MQNTSTGNMCLTYALTVLLYVRQHASVTVRRSRKFARSDHQLRLVCSSILLSVRPHRTTRLPLDRFSWNFISEYISKICGKKIQVSLKSQKCNVYCARRRVYIYDSTCISLILLKVRNVVRQKLQQKKIETTHFMFNNCFPKIVPFIRWCGNMWQSRTGHSWLSYTIRRMCFTYWIVKITDTHSVCILLIVFPLRKWSHEGL